MSTVNWAAFPMLLGTCIDDRHPEQDGFYEVEYVHEDGVFLRNWMVSLYGVRPKRHDSVLFSLPQNYSEPIIVGIVGVSGQEQQDEKPAFEIRENNVVVLKGDAPIQIITHDGRKLVEIGKSQHGPTIRICQRDADINLPGTLSISAGELKLRSRIGDVQINADKEVIIEGDLIRLN